MLEIKTNDAESAAKIIVIGVGGAGNNAVGYLTSMSVSPPKLTANGSGSSKANSSSYPARIGRIA